MQTLESSDFLSKTGIGILYIAHGRAFTTEALLSAESFKKQSQLKICLHTDQKVDSPYIDYIHFINPQHVRAKVDFIDRTPFEMTLYLDSDTFCNMDILDVFDLFPQFDIAAAHDFARKRKKYSDLIEEYDSIPYSFPEVNSGVLAYYQNSQVTEFFNLWKKYFYKFFEITNGWDQPSCRIALWESGVKLAVLPIEYNVRSKKNRKKSRGMSQKAIHGMEHLKPRIFHMHYDLRVHKGRIKKISLERVLKFCRRNCYKY